MVYWDMTARDLCQQRVTLPNGDTSWRLTPLIDAALKGRLAVLDGINRLDMGTLAVLQRSVVRIYCTYLCMSHYLTMIDFLSIEYFENRPFAIKNSFCSY